MSIRRGLVIILCAAAIAGAQQPSASRNVLDDLQRTARVRSQELFQGRGEALSMTPEDYQVHLVAMCEDLTDTVLAHPGLIRSIPPMAADQPMTPALVPGSDFFMLFFEVAAPSEQKENYYSKLTLKRDPLDPQNRNYQERLKSAILDSDGKLQPADVMRMALAATHNNYPLAMLTAHNLLKEMTEKARDQVDINTKARVQYPKDKQPPMDMVGIDPEFGLFAGQFVPLRNSSELDKMGPWYHFFVPLAAAAWSGRVAAHTMEDGEHISRHLGLLAHDDREKEQIDNCAVSATYSIHAAFDQSAEKPADPAQPATPPRPVSAVATGRIQVDLVDDRQGYGALSEADIELRSEDGRPAVVFNLRANTEEEVPIGRYSVRAQPRSRIQMIVGEPVDTSKWYGPAEQKGIEVKAGETTRVVLRLPSTTGILDVIVRDEAGRPLAGIDVSVSGPTPVGPFTSPAGFQLPPGNYRILIPQSVANGKTYRAKEATATVLANRTVEIAVLLEPYPPSPKASSISISPGWLNLNATDDDGLRATVYDDQGVEMRSALVTWSSSAPSVAQVDATGQVTGRSAGKAQIIAKSGSATGSITVTVSSSAVLSTCTIADHPRNLPAGGFGYVFHAVAKDTDGKPVPNVTFTWSGSNYVVALLNEKTGSITTETRGDLTVYAHGKGPDGSEVACSTGITIDNSYQDVLVSGKVVRPDGSAVSGATVRAMGGAAVQSDAQGNFTALAGQGPHAEGATINVEATLGTASARASGKLKKGVVKGLTRGVAEDIRITLAAAASPSGDTGANLSKRRINAHLFHIWPPDNPKDVGFLLYAKADKNKNGLFSFPDGNGGVYWRAGEDLGLYADEDSVCAVLRGYGQTSVDYNLYSYTVTCSKEGPVAKPSLVGVGPAVSGVPGASPGGTGATTGGSGMDALAAVMLFSGIVTYSDLVTPEGRPLRAQDKIVPGATLDVHKDSHVTFQATNGTVVKVNENSKITLETKNKAKLSRGNAEVKTKPESEPSFEGVNISQDAHFHTGTPDSLLNDHDTWYKVSVSDRGSSFEILEGSAQLTGASLARTDANFNIQGKPVLVRSLDLKAGDHAFAFHVPSWAGSGAKPSAAPPSPLDQPDPWNNPQIQQLIDQWLSSATPPIASPGPWRYSDWGVAAGAGTTIAGPPDHPSGWSRYQTVWSIRTKLPSVNLCTLGEFVERRIAGKSMDGCAKGGGTSAALPSWMVTSSKSPVATANPPRPVGTPAATATVDPLTIARAQAAASQPPAKPSPIVAANNPPPPAPPPPPAKPAAPPVRPADLQGVWNCTFQDISKRQGMRTLANEQSKSNFTVRPGNLVELDEHGRTLAPSYVRGHAIGYHLVLPIENVSYTFNFDLELKGSVVTGTDRVEGTDGYLAIQNVTCSDRHQTKR